MVTKQTFKVKCKSKLQLGQWRCFPSWSLDFTLKSPLNNAIKLLTPYGCGGLMDYQWIIYRVKYFRNPRFTLWVT